MFATQYLHGASNDTVFYINNCAVPTDFDWMFCYREKEQFPRPENWKVPGRFKRQKRKRNRSLMDSKSGWTKNE